MHKIVFSNVLYQVINRFAASVIGLLVTILIARAFNADGYGDYVKITAFVGLFYLFVDFGLNAMYLQKDKANTHFKSLLYSRSLVALGIILIANAIAFVLPYAEVSGIGFSETVKIGIVLFSPTILAMAMFTSAQAIFQQKLRYQYATIAGVIGSLVTLFSVLLLTLFSAPLNMVIGGLVIGYFVTAFVALVWTKQPLLPLALNKQFSQELFLASVPLGLMLIFNLVYFRIDAFILAFFQSTTDVGVYGFAYKFFDFFIAIPLFFSNALYPFMLEHGEKKEFKVAIRKYFVLFAIGSVALSILGILLAPLFAYVRPDFALSIMPFRILLLSLPLFFVTSLLQWLLIAKKQQWFLLCVYGCSLVVNIVLNLVFIPLYSYIASAIITGIMEALILIALAVRLYRYNKTHE